MLLPVPWETSPHHGQLMCALAWKPTCPPGLPSLWWLLESSRCLEKSRLDGHDPGSPAGLLLSRGIIFVLKGWRESGGSLRGRKKLSPRREVWEGNSRSLECHAMGGDGSGFREGRNFPTRRWPTRGVEMALSPQSAAPRARNALGRQEGWDGVSLNI